MVSLVMPEGGMWLYSIDMNQLNLSILGLKSPRVSPTSATWYFFDGHVQFTGANIKYTAGTFTSGTISKMYIYSSFDSITIEVGVTFGPARLNALMHSGTGDNALNIFLSGDDTIIGAELNDVLLGRDGNDKLSGHAGSDKLYGGDGNDTLNGNDGNDLLDGGTKADVMSGHTGNDQYFIDTALDQTLEALNQGIDTLRSSTVHLDLSSLSRANIENAVLIGTTALNITGSAADNVLLGNGGRNIIKGGAGNDRIDGNGAGDVLTGGDGADTFVFLSRANSNARGWDVITDFQHGVDKIDLADGMDFRAREGAAFVPGIGGQVRWDQRGGSTFIEVELDGDSVADLIIELKGTHTITKSDLLIMLA